MREVNKPMIAFLISPIGIIGFVVVFGQVGQVIVIEVHVVDELGRIALVEQKRLLPIGNTIGVLVGVHHVVVVRIEAREYPCVVDLA